MNDFKQTLESEMEKRDTSPVPTSHITPKRKFSYLTFALGIGFIAFILGGLLAWAQLKANTTAEVIQKRLPSKTSIVQVIDTQTFRMGGNQKRITLPPLTDPNAVITPEENAEDEITLSEEELEIMNMIKDNTAGPDPSAPFNLYRQAYRKTQKPSLSFVVMDLGLSYRRTKSIIEKLPNGIALALSPYSENLDNLITAAREDGHEVWMTLPMQTAEYPMVDSGPLTLLTDASLEQNKDRATQILNLGAGHVGFIPNINHIFKGEDGDINPAIQQLLDAGYAILDSNQDARSFVANLAYKKEYAHGQNNFWLDTELTPLAMNQRLRQMMELAEAKGNAVMLLRPYPASIDALQKFLNSAPAQKFDLAPASAYLKNAG